MGIVNLILSLIIILIFLAAQPLRSFIDRRFFDLSAEYRTKYEAEKERRVALEEKVSRLEKELSLEENTARTVPLRTLAFNYTGDDIFRLINEARRDANVGELSLDPDLCYLSSYRLAQLLDLGKLDTHEGFISFDPAAKFKYERVGENLAYGYASAADTVRAWEKSPGHNLNLKDPVNTLGCVAANSGFAVFIAGREN